jgi:hypothetical protein
MRQSEARDLRSFLTEPVEEIVVEGMEGAESAESTGGQLHEVWARFSSPDEFDKDDLTLQQTMPMPRIAEVSGAQSGLSALRPYRLQRYQSRGVAVSVSRSASGTLRLRPAGSREQRATADLAPAPQKIVPGVSAPALQSWERRRRTLYTWLVLLTLFLLVVLGGMGLDSLIANYR